MSTRPPLFSVYECVPGRWFWGAVSTNGMTVAESPAYSTKSNATRAMRRFLDGVRYGGYEEVGGE